MEKEMKNRKAALQQKLDGAIKAYRDHVSVEVTEADAEAHATRAVSLRAAMDKAANDVQAENAAAEAERLLAPSTTEANRAPSITVGERLKPTDAKGGFGDFGEFVSAVMGGSRANASRVDERLQLEAPGAQAPTTYGNEGIGADGGYLVPPEFAARIFGHSLDEGSFLPLTTQLPISGNSITLPKDETTPWGTDGVRVYWAAEATAATQTKPKLGERTLKLRKLIGLVPLTEELMSDSLAGGAYVQQKLGSSLAWKVNSAIVDGSGVQVPLGFRTSPVMVSITKEVGQAADSINANNIAKMFGRLPAVSQRSNALRWLLNNDAINQVMTMTLGNQPIWTPPTEGFKSAPAGFLLGRPIVPTQVCQTVGDAGDIQLVDFAQYVTIAKGPQYAESMHLFFDYDLGAFRLTFRMDGSPWQSAAISPANGSNSLSPFVQIEART
jgi:HK97 family phage major capsid protein